MCIECSYDENLTTFACHRPLLLKPALERLLSGSMVYQTNAIQNLTETLVWHLLQIADIRHPILPDITKWHDGLCNDAWKMSST